MPSGVSTLYISHKSLIYSLLFLVVYSTTVTLAAPPTTPYYPTDNITDPTCSPTDTNCYVSVFPDQTSNTGKLLFTDGTNPTWASNLYWDETNNYLGIGTSSPDQLLHLQASTSIHSLVRTTNPASNVYHAYENSGDATDAWGVGRDNSGRFVINHSTGSQYTSGTTTTRFSIGSDKLNILGPGATSSTFTAQFHNSTGTNNGMVIRDDGNIGIGTSSPVAKLTVNSIAAGSEGLRIDGAGGGFAFVVKGGTDYTAHIRAGATIGANYLTTPPVNGLIVEGFVGIGTDAPSQQLEITGNFKIPETTASAGIVYFGTSRFIHKYGTDNIFIGENAGNFTQTGAGKNVAIGTDAGASITTSMQNTLVGYRTGASITTGWSNNAFGYITLENVTTGTGNNAFGDRVQNALTTGELNSGFGDMVQFEMTGSRNSAFGAVTQYRLLSGDGNSAFGAQAQNYLRSGTNNTAIGFQSQVGSGALTFTGSYNTAVGYHTQASITTGTYNTALGYDAQALMTTGTYNIALGTQVQSFGAFTGSYNIGMGYQSQYRITTGTGNVASGVVAQYALTTGEYNTAIGPGTHRFLTTGNYNLALGGYAGYGAVLANAPVTDDYGILIGYEANRSVASATKLTNYVAIGYRALVDKSNQVVIGNSSIVETLLYGKVGIGTSSPTSTVSIAGSMDFIGSDIPSSAPIVSIGSAGALTGAYRYRVTYITAIGETDPGIYSSEVSPVSQKVELSNIPIGGSNVIGRKIYRQIANAGINNNLYYLLATINDNTTTVYSDNIPDGSLGSLYPTVNTTSAAIDVNTYPLLRVGNVSTYFGVNSGISGTGYANTGFGASTLYAITSGEYNTAIGRDSLRATTTGSNNTSLGTSSLFTNTIGHSNTALGVSSLYSNLSGNLNTAIGRTAAYTNTSGSNNTNIGYGSSYRNSTGSSNTVIGVNAGYGNSGGSNINSNVIIGKEAGMNLATGGDANILIGTSTGDAITTGAQNIIIGHNIDAPSNTANGQISIGNLIFATGATATGTSISAGSVGIGVASPAYTLQVGNSSIVGIVARFENSTGTCDINPTTTSLSCSSDLTLKKNITSLDNSLSLISALRPVSYNWNTQNDTDSKIPGFIAQEVESLIPFLVTTDPNTNLKSLNYTLFTPYIVKSIQELDIKLTSLSDLSLETPNTLGSLIKSFIENGVNIFEQIFVKRIKSESVESESVKTKELCTSTGRCLSEEALERLIDSVNEDNQDVSSPTQSTPAESTIDEEVVTESESLVETTNESGDISEDNSNIEVVEEVSEVVEAVTEEPAPIIEETEVVEPVESLEE